MEETVCEQDLKITLNTAEWVELKSEKKRLLTNRLY